LPRRENREWETAVAETDAACWRRLEPALAERDFDGALIPALLDALPPQANLFVGNSLPVRHLDQYGRSRPKSLHVYGNRGASGIDGNISTGLGVAAANGRPTAILVGDLTAYHDLNALLFLKEEGRRKKEERRNTQRATRNTQHATRNMPPITLIILNTNGGGIFRRLPIARHDPPFTEMFLTPHGLSFEGAATMFKLAYRRLEGREGFGDLLATTFTAPDPHLIEIVTDGARDDQIRREVNEIVNG
jgi:2-succinyl-5-enolpyruvyl-6-hydroxy-3-cyclohexene-1-carboxylate synthase